MPSERARVPFAACLGLAIALCLALASCRDPGPAAAEATVERFAGVARQAGSATAAQSAFCERSYPAGGEGARRWTPPPERPAPGGPDAAARGERAWTWVNLWATWCTPCVEEMELLGQWRDAFSREGVPVRLELWSVDENEREKDLAAWRAKGLPGRLRWLRSGRDLDPLLDALGVDRGAMIPIHALVDPAGWIRCVRVGAIHDQDYAAVKGFLSR